MMATYAVIGNSTANTLRNCARSANTSLPPRQRSSCRTSTATLEPSSSSPM